MKLFDQDITSPGTFVSATMQLNGTPRNLGLQANMTGGTGGTSIDAYAQCSHDGGATWGDVANFHYANTAAIHFFNLSAATPVTTQATPTDGSLAANTAKDGQIGPLTRVKVVTVGTYSGGTHLRVDATSIDQA